MLDSRVTTNVGRKRLVGNSKPRVDVLMDRIAVLRKTLRGLALDGVIT
jgi:hypothetical protein